MEEQMNLVEVPSEAESSGLASRARAGDREALNTLLLRHVQWLRRVARVELGARLRKQIDSMDVVQEVGIIAIQRIGELRVTDGPAVRRWLRSIRAPSTRRSCTRPPRCSCRALSTGPGPGWRPCRPG